MIFLVILFSFLSSVNSQVFLTFNSSYYADLSITIAKHYRSSCIYLFSQTQSEVSIFEENIIKQIAVKYVSTNVYSFNDYHQLLAESRIIKCHVPLQVVISNDEATKMALESFSHRNNMHGSYSGGGAVWLIFLETITESFLEKYFEKINTPFDSEIIVAEHITNDEMKLKEVYRVQKGKPLRSPTFMINAQKHGTGFDKKSHLYSRRRDLEGIVLNIGYLKSIPAVYKEIINGQPQLIGYIADTWKYLEETFNFTSNLTFKKEYGVRGGSGIWSGLIGGVQQNVFDAGVADLGLTRKRFDAISYSKPLWITTLHTYYQSMEVTTGMDVLFLPLEAKLWGSLILWLLVSSFILYVGCSLSDHNFMTSDNWTFQNSFFFVAGALCGQGGINEPKRYTCKMLFFASFLITGVVLPSYSASLISYLTNLPVYIPFQTMKEFYNVGNLRMTLMYSSYEYEIFSHESSSNSYMNKIFQRDMAPLPPEMYPTSVQEGIQEVCKNRYVAFFGTVDDVDYALQQEERREGIKRNCSIASVLHDGGKFNVAMIYPKNSSYRGLFNNYYLQANGIRKRLQLKYGIRRRATPSAENIHKPVQLQNIIMIFAIVGSGLIASLFCLAIETKFKNKNKRFFNNKNISGPILLQEKMYPDENLSYYH